MYRSEKSFMRDPATVNCRIYVGNLDESVTPDSLEDQFKKHGNVMGVVVQRGFGFIQFEEETSAQDAIKNEHGVMFQGKKLNVKQAFDNKNKTMESDTVGNSSKVPADGPARKMPRRGGFVSRGGRGPDRAMDRDNSPHGDGERDFRDGSGFYGREEPQFSGSSNYSMPHVAERALPVPERNDCEIIVVSKTLTEYAEYIEQRLKSVGLTVDLLFPNEDVPIGRVLANISSRGCLYAVLVMPQNEEHRSLTLNILHGLPQEHRNMPVDDAVSLITRNFDAYMRGEKAALGSAPMSLSERHPEPIQSLLNLLTDNRQLTTLQYDRIIKYLQEKRELQFKQEVGESNDDKDQNTKQAKLQNRIMSILNQSPGTPSPVSAPIFPLTATPTPTPVPKPTAPILLNDPSVQKALDSLMQGDLLKNITGSRY